MTGRQFMFFATVMDLAPTLSWLETKERLQYTLMRRLQTDKPQTFLSFADIPDFGRTYDPLAVANPAYLVALRGTVVNVETIPQKAGGANFAIDQRLNEDTIVLRPGGRYGNDTLLYGMIGTVSDSVASRNLYDFMVEPYRARFAQVHEFFLGPEASALLKSGARLTTAAYSSREFDLKP